MKQRQWNPPQLELRNNNYRGVMYPKATICIVLLIVLSIGMSVSNIRQAFNILPNPNTNNRDLTHLTTLFPTDDKPQDLPSSNIHISGFAKYESSVNITRSENKNRGDQVLEAPKPAETITNKDTIGNIPTSESNVARNGTSNITSLDESNKSLSTQVSLLDPPPLLSVIPNANNTVISLVSMGKLVNTFLVERCIRSIRRRGQFTGIIMVFTDSVGYKQYQETIPSWDDRTIIIQGREEDMNPREENNEDPGGNHTEPQLKKYRQDTMVFKRFKTHHSKYIADNPALSDSIRYVMYVDIDNIIGSRIDSFFEGYTKMVINQYQQAADSHRNNITTSSARDGVDKLADESITSFNDGFGFVSMFRDKHLKSKFHRYVRYTSFMFSLLFPVLFCSLC
jgi:hypothetical protein